MSTMTATTPQIHALVEAIRVSLARALRRALYLLLALTIGLLNPALCVLTCYLHQGAHATQGRTLAHTHHEHQVAAEEPTHPHPGCSTDGAHQPAPPTPRAAYDGVPLPLGVALIALTLLPLTLQILWRPHPAPPHRPPTPPPQALAFI